MKEIGKINEIIRMINIGLPSKMKFEIIKNESKQYSNHIHCEKSSIFDKNGIILTVNFIYDKQDKICTINSRFTCLDGPLGLEKDINIFVLKVVYLYNLIIELVDELCNYYNIDYYYDGTFISNEKSIYLECDQNYNFAFTQLNSQWVKCSLYKFKMYSANSLGFRFLPKLTLNYSFKLY